MKKLMYLSSMLVFLLCLFFSASSMQTTNISFASTNTNIETIDITNMPEEGIGSSEGIIFSPTGVTITDPGKRYFLTGTNTGKTITFENTTNFENTFYVEISNLYLTCDPLMPSIVIRDNGSKTNVYFYLDGNSIVTGHKFGALSLASYEDTNAYINIVFASNDEGSLKLLTDFGGTPAIYVQDNVQHNISVNTNNSILKTLNVAGIGYYEVDTGFYQATRTGKTTCEIKLSKAENISHTVNFNLMGRGTPIESILVPSTNNNITLPSLNNHGDYVFCGWYTDPQFKNRCDNSSKIENDTTLYACWQLKSEIPITEPKIFPVWAITLIVIGSVLFLFVLLYFCIYFLAYKKGKIINKFTKFIYKPFRNNKNKLSKNSN